MFTTAVAQLDAPVRRDASIRSTPAPLSGPSDVTHAIAVLRGLGPESRRFLDPREAEALAVIYRSYGTMLLTVARRLLGEGADAEDVVHDVFCRLPWVVAQYRDGGFGGWLKQMTLRTALMRVRAAKARTASENDMTTWAYEPPTVGDFAMLERRHALRSAVGTLSHSLRQVVVLRCFFDYSHEQIADALDISKSASEVRYCRALKQLRQTLHGD
jgi:RNA polymerase sigma-70 factor (ECF subfamily)